MTSTVDYNGRFSENFMLQCCLSRYVIPPELRSIVQQYRSFNPTITAGIEASSNLCRHLCKIILDSSTIHWQDYHNDLYTFLGVFPGTSASPTGDVGDLLDLMNLHSYWNRDRSSAATKAFEHRVVLSRCSEIQIEQILECVYIRDYTLFRGLSTIPLIEKYLEIRGANNVSFQAISNNEHLNQEDRKLLMRNALSGKYVKFKKPSIYD